MMARNEIHTHRTVSVNVRDTGPYVLVVEDDPSLADMLETAFRTWGYHVRVAKNGQEGLDICAKHSIDGVLLDMHMPIMDGRTMLDELRWEGYQFPVLIMSGGSDIRTLKQLLQEGAQGFFIKPFELEYLRQTCEEIFSPLLHLPTRSMAHFSNDTSMFNLEACDRSFDHHDKLNPDLRLT